MRTAIRNLTPKPTDCAPTWAMWNATATPSTSLTAYCRKPLKKRANASTSKRWSTAPTTEAFPTCDGRRASSDSRWCASRYGPTCPTVTSTAIPPWRRLSPTTATDISPTTCSTTLCAASSTSGQTATTLRSRWRQPTIATSAPTC